MPTQTINKNIKFTYSDYLIYPTNGKQLQLIAGDFFMTPAPIIFHQDVSRNLETIIYKFVAENNLGKVYYAPTDVVLSTEDVIQPDILFVAKDRLNIIKEKNIKGAPDLIVEILSAKTKKMDSVIKRKLYAKYKVKEYWLVDLDKKQVEVLLLADNKYKSEGIYQKGQIIKSQVIQGLKVKVNDIFKR